MGSVLRGCNTVWGSGGSRLVGSLGHGILSFLQFLVCTASYCAAKKVRFSVGLRGGGQGRSLCWPGDLRGVGVGEV